MDKESAVVMNLSWVRTDPFAGSGSSEMKLPHAGESVLLLIKKWRPATDGFDFEIITGYRSGHGWMKSASFTGGETGDVAFLSCRVVAWAKLPIPAESSNW